MSVIIWKLNPFSHYCKMWTLCNIWILSLKYGSTWLWMMSKCTMFLLMESIFRSFYIFWHNILNFTYSTWGSWSPFRFIINFTNSSMLIVILFTTSVRVFCLIAKDFTFFASSASTYLVSEKGITIIWKRGVNVWHC